jgi:hypothetical protein
MFRPTWPFSGVQDIYFHMLEEFCFAASFSLPFLRGHTLRVFHLCFVLVLFSFVIFFLSLRVCLSACSFFVVTTRKKRRKKPRNRILQAYEYKISYTPEDGHVGRNM